jgi:hypothetical protein
MRVSLLLLALILLAGCSRSGSSGKPASPTAVAVASTTGQKAAPTVSAPPRTSQSIEDQPIRTPAFQQKFDEQLKPGEMLALDSSRPTRHTLTVSVKATPADAKVSTAVMLKQDFDNAKALDKKDIDPKAIMASNEGGNNYDVKAPMPAMLPYVILVRNVGNEMAKVEVILKAQ